MHEQLRAVAKILREKQAQADADKQVKIARMLQAATGLEVLKKKIQNG